MTNHPLTDDICDSLIKEFVGFDPDDMRTAADWQLEQVVKWLEETKYDYSYDAHEDPSGVYDYMDNKINDLKKAMRPTQGEHLQDEAVNKFIKNNSAALTELADS